ncbi:MAG: ABC transporter ATP-binding protein [Peptococcaceae bacterium]
MTEEQRGRQSGKKPGSGPMRGPMAGPRVAMPAEKAKDFKGTLKRLMGYLKPRRYTIILVIVMAVLSTVFSIVSPKIMGLATTKLFEGILLKLKGVPGAGVDFPYILRIILILAVLYLISAFFSYLQQYIMAGVTQKTVFDIRNGVNDKLTRLPIKFFDKHTHGEILSRITNDVDNIATTLQQSMTQLITSITTLIGIIVMMLSISPVMTLILLVTLPFYVIVTKSIATRSQKYFADQQKALGELNGHVEEMYTGNKIVKAFGYEEKSIQKFNQTNAELYNAGWKAQFVSGIIMPLMNFINNIGYVLVSVVGGIFVTQQRIAIGDVQAFIQYSRQFTQPITQVANIANIIQSTIASAERVFELLNEPEELGDEKAADVIELPRGEVGFKNVKFSYKKDVPLIEDMNIRVNPGQTVAIVGPTGAGKTTLVNLLMRFYELDDGEITIDGVNIADLKREKLRSIFGMVLQDTWLFNGTIKENIGYGRKDFSEEEVVRAAKAANADHFIRTLPEGYDTLINEEGSNISQGQKQLITIARAMLKDPSILILDEATSSVDTRTEAYIQKAMTELMKGRTSFVIAHRLSTIRDADLILVMNNGRVIEQGTHQELLEKNGFYAELYDSQFAGSGA